MSESIKRISWPGEYMRLRLAGMQALTRAGGNRYDPRVERCSQDMISWVSDYYISDFNFPLLQAFFSTNHLVSLPYSNLDIQDGRNLQMATIALGMVFDSNKIMRFDFNYVNYREKLILDLLKELKRLRDAKLYLSDDKSITPIDEYTRPQAKIYALSTKTSKGHTTLPQYRLFLQAGAHLVPYPYSAHRFLTLR